MASPLFILYKPFIEEACLRGPKVLGRLAPTQEKLEELAGISNWGLMWDDLELTIREDTTAYLQYLQFIETQHKALSAALGVISAGFYHYHCPADVMVQLKDLKTQPDQDYTLDKILSEKICLPPNKKLQF